MPTTVSVAEKHYISARCWLHFSDAFPGFEKFDHVRDIELVDELDRYALDWLRKNKAVMKQRLRDRKAKRRTALKKRSRLIIARPEPRPIEQLVSSTSKTGSAPPPAPVYEPGRPVRSKRRQRGSLGCRIAYRAGWITTELPKFGSLSPSHKMFLLWTEEGGSERADSIIAAMQCRLPDTEIGKQLRELQLRFGRVPASDIDDSEQVRIRLQIKSLSAEGSRHPDEAIHWNIAKELWRVAQEVADLRDADPQESEGSVGEGGATPVGTTSTVARSKAAASTGSAKPNFPNPSAPMSKAQAADRWGGEMTVDKLTSLMNAGTVRFLSLNRQTFIFCRDDVPNLSTGAETSRRAGGN